MCLRCAAQRACRTRQHGTERGKHTAPPGHEAVAAGLRNRRQPAADSRRAHLRVAASGAWPAQLVGQRARKPHPVPRVEAASCNTLTQWPWSWPGLAWASSSRGWPQTRTWRAVRASRQGPGRGRNWPFPRNGSVKRCSQPVRGRPGRRSLCGGAGGPWRDLPPNPERCAGQRPAGCRAGEVSDAGRTGKSAATVTITGKSSGACQDAQVHQGGREG